MAVQPNRLPFLLASVGLILLFGAFVHQMNVVPDTWKSHLSKAVSTVSAGTTKQHKDAPSKSLGNVDGAKTWPAQPSQSSFYDIALKHGTDKVTRHHYHHIYQKYLEPYRPKPLKFLEIGLGCDMEYGPGASYYTWLEYLPQVDLYYIEYDADCAKKWAHKTTGATIFSGDQANVTFLHEFLAEVGMDFDVIVDDGGHLMHQQITSLEVLWKAVKKGGLYFCEDLQTSWWDDAGGDRANTGTKKTMVGMIKELVDDLTVETGGHARKHKVSEDMLFVDCMEEVCAFTKKE